MVSAKVLWQAGAVTVPGTGGRPLRLEQSERGRVQAKSRAGQRGKLASRGEGFSFNSGLNQAIGGFGQGSERTCI